MIGKYPRKATYTERTMDLLDLDSEYISPSYTRDYPFVVQSGMRREVMDVDCNWYLDFGAGIAVTSTGHCHPRVVKAIQDQAARLIHMSGTDFYYEPQIKLAEKLSDISGEGRRQAFFANSGAEAVEAAMKLARRYKGGPCYIAFTGAFHGRTLGALSLTGSREIQRRHYAPLQPVTHVPYPDCYNCWFNYHPDHCEKHGCVCVDYIDSEVFGRTLPPEDCSAIFVEAIQGEGGYIVPPDFWWDDLNKLCGTHEIMMVIDEVQSGMGRTGKWFAHHHFKTQDNRTVEPDMITIAKGVASGMPLGVMLADRDIMATWEPGSHASTFGGNPVCCAAALATIEVIEKERMMDNARIKGDHLHDLLRFLRDSYGIVENPRGLGLMRAVDVLGENKKGTYRDQALMRCFEKGLILLGCGKSGIRFCPALNVTKEEVETCVCVLEDSIKEVLK